MKHLLERLHYFVQENSPLNLRLRSFFHFLLFPQEYLFTQLME